MSRPVAPIRATAALAAHELRLTARRGENILVTLVIPPAVLAFFATVGILPGIAGKPVDFLLPGALAIAIVAAGLVNLGIATSYERNYGVLKRLGGAPIPRWSVVAAKMAGVAVLEVLQVALLLVVAVALGWTGLGAVSAGPALLALALGTIAFAGLGLLMAGTLRAEATLALANALFLAFLMVGGVLIPLDHLPAPVAAVARWLPASALTDALRAALGGGDPGWSLTLLTAWAAGAAGLAARLFRWE